MNKKEPYHILLRVETSRASGRNFLKGVANYARFKDDWALECEPIGIEKSFIKFNYSNFDGIITRVWDRKTAQDIIKCCKNTIFFYANEYFPEYTCIYTDHGHIGRIAADHLLERGIKKFAFLGYKNMVWSGERGGAFMKTVSDAGFEASKFEIEFNYRKFDYWSKTKNSSLVKWLEKLPKPVGIFASNDELGRHIIESCKAYGMQIPDQVAVIGVDNDECICDLTYPPLSSIRLNTEQSGFDAAKALDKMFHGEELENKTILTPIMDVIERQSSNILCHDDKTITAAIKYIKVNVKNLIQVTDVANEVCLSRRELLRRFKSTTGLTVYDVIRNEKIKAIEKYLTASNLSISEVAYEFKFSGPEKLSRFFTQNKGVSPKKFRTEAGIT